jgi:hypothetical protein
MLEFLKPVGWHRQYEYYGNSLLFCDATNKAPRFLREYCLWQRVRQPKATRPPRPPRTAIRYGNPPTSGRPLPGKRDQQFRLDCKNTLRSAPPALYNGTVTFSSPAVLLASRQTFGSQCRPPAFNTPLTGSAPRRVPVSPRCTLSVFPRTATKASRLQARHGVTIAWPV